MTCPSGFEDIYKEVVRAGRHLAEQATTGHLIHGDLQFGNIVVQHTAHGPHSWLIDWEVSEVMPLAYEFAMLYTFLLGPEGQVEPKQRAQYERLKPLTAFWNALKPLLLGELGIAEETFKHAVVFRMGTAGSISSSRPSTPVVQRCAPERYAAPKVSDTPDDGANL